MLFGRAICSILLACVVFLPLIGRLAADARQRGQSRHGRASGRTVFAGTKVEEFKAHILGVLENAMGPQPQPDSGAPGGRAAGHHRGHRRDERQPGLHRRPAGRRGLVLSRRLLARAHRRHHANRRDGRTPRAAPAAGRWGRGRARTSRCRSARRRWLPRCSASSRATSPFAQSPADVRFAGVSTGTLGGAELGAMLRPIATPLVMGGFRGEVADLVSSGFASSGFSPMSGGSAPAREVKATAPLAPGDAVGVGLVSGDLSLGGTGTVTPSRARASTPSGTRSTTWGRRAFPMTRAWIHTLLPSLMSSSKLGSIGEVIGTFDQDRATAIAGTLGAGPADVAHHAGARYRSRPEAHLPVLASCATSSSRRSSPTSRSSTRSSRTSASSARRASWSRAGRWLTSTARSRSKICSRATPHRSAQPATCRPDHVPAEERLRAGRDRQAGHDDRVVRIAAHGGRSSACGSTRPVRKAGRSVPLKILVKTGRGEAVMHTVTVDMPANATGPLTLMVADGTRLAQMEQRESRMQQQPQDAAQMVRAFNKARKNNRLYVRLRQRRRRRRRRRRDAGVAARVGAGDVGCGPQRRRREPAAQRDARRVGHPDRLRRQRRPFPLSTLDAN